MVEKYNTPERLRRAQAHAKQLDFSIQTVGKDGYWLWDDRDGGHKLIGGEWKLYKIERWLDDFHSDAIGIKTVVTEETIVAAREARIIKEDPL